MLPLDYVHALCMVGIAIYVWRREPLRLLLTPLMLLSFLVLYGVGNIVYFAGAETVPDVHAEVTASLILMWLGLIVGIETARLSFPALARQSQLVIRSWQRSPLSDKAYADQVLAALGVLIAVFILAVFVGFGNPPRSSTSCCSNRPSRSRSTVSNWAARAAIYTRRSSPRSRRS